MYLLFEFFSCMEISHHVILFFVVRKTTSLPNQLYWVSTIGSNSGNTKMSDEMNPFYLDIFPCQLFLLCFVDSLKDEIMKGMRKRGKKQRRSSGKCSGPVFWELCAREGLSPVVGTYSAIWNHPESMARILIARVENSWEREQHEQRQRTRYV